MYNVGQVGLFWEIGFNTQEFSTKWCVYAIIWVFKTALIWASFMKLQYIQLFIILNGMIY